MVGTVPGGNDEGGEIAMTPGRLAGLAVLTMLSVALLPAETATKSEPAAKKSAPAAAPAKKQSSAAKPQAAPAAKTTASSGNKAPAPAASKATAGRAPTSSTARKTTAAKKGTVPARQTARRGPSQTAPTPERYKEIQEALAAKGYLSKEADGKWDDSSIEALKKFQQDQNLEPSGKLTSLSLIALGLGPKYEPAVKAAGGQERPAGGSEGPQSAGPPGEGKEPR